MKKQPFVNGVPVVTNTDLKKKITWGFSTLLDICVLVVHFPLKLFYLNTIMKDYNY